MSIKSLYNIAGFLGAQSRSNPSDHGDSWTSHKGIQQKLQPRNATSRQECITTLDLLTQLNKRYLEITRKPELIPIDPLTINVGDTVKLVRDQAINSGFGHGLTIGNYYKVVFVDAADKRMPIQIADDVGGHVWMFAEDMLQVI